MSKKKQPQQFNQSKTERSTSASSGYKHAVERVEVSGFWDFEGTIEGKLIDAYQFIQKGGKGKGNVGTVFVIDLLHPIGARVKLDGGGFDHTELEPREKCGVLGSVGLRHLAAYGGCFVKVTRKGKKTLGNGNEMWHFDVEYRGTPTRLDVRPPFQAAEVPATAPNGATREPGDDSDELPF